MTHLWSQMHYVDPVLRVSTIILKPFNSGFWNLDQSSIKMTYRDLPYYKGIRAETCREYKIHKNKHKNHENSLHTFRKWSITWSQFVVSSHSRRWLIRHSMASTAIYSSLDYGTIKHGRPSLDSGSQKKTNRRFIPSKSLLLQWLLTFLL